MPDLQEGLVLQDQQHLQASRGQAQEVRQRGKEHEDKDKGQLRAGGGR